MTNLYTGKRRSHDPLEPREVIGTTGRGEEFRKINLAAMVRKIAYETVDPSSLETRIEAAIRGMFTEARKNPAAFREITERGWGRVPVPVTVTLVGAGLIEHARNLGLKPEHVAADPTLLALFHDGGVDVIEGEFKIVDVDIVV